METRAGDPGAFARFDLNRVPTPAFVVDEVAVRRNLAILADVKARSGAKVLSALKAFSMWSLADVVGEYLDGVCTSGLWEARLARDHYKGEIATYCAGYKEADMSEIVSISDHVIFNSPNQHRRFAAFLNDSVDVGLRINPEHAEGEVAKYDPCSPGSRLGFPI
ncbi:MAG TPA: carboxynorspermidine decarboxylase, partial [Sphingorhabdus sp.]|nr:carboxynorspermidine decarboxylase [Sphingorhabdus sp.]